MITSSIILTQHLGQIFYPHFPLWHLIFTKQFIEINILLWQNTYFFYQAIFYSLSIFYKDKSRAGEDTEAEGLKDWGHILSQEKGKNKPPCFLSQSPSSS